MSRAFMKEFDSDPSAEALPELPQSSHPNYVTKAGLAALRARLAALHRERDKLAASADEGAKLALAHVQRDIRFVEGRIERAIPVSPADHDQSKVGFAATVEVRDGAGVVRQFMIVGEDEAEPAHNKVSWVSPLAQALTGAQVGDAVNWKRPSGDLELEVLTISYPES